MGSDRVKGRAMWDSRQKARVRTESSCKRELLLTCTSSFRYLLRPEQLKVVAIIQGSLSLPKGFRYLIATLEITILVPSSGSNAKFVLITGIYTDFRKGSVIINIAYFPPNL